jgi:hypothetical protein
MASMLVSFRLSERMQIDRKNVMAMEELMKRFLAVLGCLVALFVMPGSVLGSGTYAGRPPKPPDNIDAAQYELGKNLFMGTVLPKAGVGDKPAQEARLKRLQDRLPRKVQPTVNLPALAGKLTPQQLAGVEYYLAVRFKVK